MFCHTGAQPWLMQPLQTPQSFPASNLNIIIKEKRKRRKSMNCKKNKLTHHGYVLYQCVRIQKRNQSNPFPLFLKLRTESAVAVQQDVNVYFFPLGRLVLCRPSTGLRAPNTPNDGRIVTDEVFAPLSKNPCRRVQTTTVLLLLLFFNHELKAGRGLPDCASGIDSADNQRHIGRETAPAIHRYAQEAACANSPSCHLS